MLQAGAVAPRDRARAARERRRIGLVRLARRVVQDAVVGGDKEPVPPVGRRLFSVAPSWRWVSSRSEGANAEAGSRTRWCRPRRGPARRRCRPRRRRNVRFVLSVSLRQPATRALASSVGVIAYPRRSFRLSCSVWSMAPAFPPRIARANPLGSVSYWMPDTRGGRCPVHRREEAGRVGGDAEVLHGLRRRVLVVVGERTPEAVREAGAEIGRGLSTGDVVALAVLAEALAVGGQGQPHSSRRGIALGHHDRGADRVADVDGGERPVEHVDALQRLRRHHVPARRVEAAQEVRQQVAVDAGTRGRARAQRPKLRPPRSALRSPIALADGRAGHVLEGVLGVHEVLPRQLLAATGGRGRRQVRRQRSRRRR